MCVLVAHLRGVSHNRIGSLDCHPRGVSNRFPLLTRCSIWIGEHGCLYSNYLLLCVFPIYIYSSLPLLVVTWCCSIATHLRPRFLYRQCTLCIWCGDTIGSSSSLKAAVNMCYRIELVLLWTASDPHRAFYSFSKSHPFY